MSVKIPYEQIVNENYIGKEINPVNHNDIYSAAQNIDNNIKKDEGINLLIIDPQRDFIDPDKGALPVKNAIEDIKRIIRFIYNNIENISSIYVTLDTHRYDSIFHPIMWKDASGNTVSPFTEITLEKIENNEIIPVYNKDIQTNYVRKLKEQGSQNLMIWPYHCIYASDGWLIEKQLYNMLMFFECYKKTNINKIIKGTDSFSEMYGIIRPEVSSEYTKQYDNSWVKDIIKADKIYVCGEAKDYCVYESVKQFTEIYKDNKNTLEKVNIMMNCCSDIGDKKISDEKYNKLSKDYGIKLINI